MSTERAVNYRAIHTKNSWRKARHDNIENALGTKRGAKALFTGKAAIDYGKHGRPLYVIIWENDAKEGFVVKPDPDKEGEILRTKIPIEIIMQYEASGEARTRELEEFFLNKNHETRDSTEDAPLVDQRVLNSILTRRGQQEFRKELLRVYKGRCAITDCDAEPVLEAAHIVPHSETQSYAITNGILLRADIHTLFDLFLLSINPESAEVVLVPELLRSYPGVIGTRLRAPDNRQDFPSSSALKQHYQKWQRMAKG